MIRDLPVIDKHSKLVVHEKFQSHYHGGSDFFIAGSGSEILPDTKWYADDILNAVSPTPAFIPVCDIIQIEKSFQKQFFELYHNKTKEDYYKLKAKMQLSLSFVMYLTPSKISLQLTGESFYYTLIFTHTTIYFEHYYVDVSNDMDEALVGIYENGKNILNYGGSLNNAFNKALQYFQQRPKVTRGIYGIPYRNFTQY